MTDSPSKFQERGADEVPDVSVIMSAFNAQRTVAAAIGSVLRQSCARFELLVVDDASTDRTVSVVQSFEDPRVRLLTRDRNEGPGPCRDAAISLARGRWVTFLDADDIYEEHRLEAMLRVANAHPADIIVDDIVDCHDSGATLVPWRRVWDERRFGPSGASIREVDLVRLLAEDRLLVKPMMSRELILRSGATHGTSRNGEDLAFLFALFASGAVIRYVPIPTYLYRMTPNSLSTSNPDRHRLYRDVFAQARPLFAADPRALDAIDLRLSQLSRMQVYLDWFGALRQRRWAGVAKSAWTHPWVLAEFAKRVASRLPFHAHRIIHGGARRTIE